MHERISVIEYKGLDIVALDYRQLEPEVFRSTVVEVTDALLKSDLQDVRLLLDVTGSFADKHVVAAFKKAGTDVRSRTVKTAVIGVSPVQRFLISVINRFSSIGAEVFDGEDAARDWLVL